MTNEEHDSVKRKTLHALPWTVIARIGRFLMAFITSIIVVRLLGKESYGIYSVVHSMQIIGMTIVTFGFNQLLLRKIPEIRVKHGERRSRYILISAVIVEIIVWIALLLAVLLLKGTVERLYGAEIFPYLFFAIAVVLATVLFNTISSGVTSIYQTRVMAQWHIIGGAVVTLLTYIFLVNELGVNGVFAAAALSNFAVFLMLGWFFFSGKNHRMQGTSPSTIEESSAPTIWNLTIDAVPFFLIALMTYISWKQSEVLFIGHFVGETEAGFFDLGYNLADLMINFLPLAILPLMFTAFAEAYAKKPEHITESIVLHYKLLFMITAPLSAGGVLLGDLAIGIIYSPDMAPGGPICRIFSFVLFVALWGAPLSLAIYSIGKTWWNFLFYAITTFIIITLDYVFISRYGFYGAVVGTSVAVILSPFLRYVILKRFVATIIIPWRFNLKCMAAAAMAFPLLLARPYITNFPFLLVAGISVIVIYGVFIKIFKVLTPDVRNYIAMSRIPFRQMILKILS